MIRVGILLICFLFLINNTVFAEEALSVTPNLMELSLHENTDSVEYYLEINNQGKSEIGISLKTLDFGTMDESGGVLFLGRDQNEFSKKYGLAEWINLEKDFVSLKPGETEKIRVVVENKESLSPGGHYGSVIGETALEDDLGGKLKLRQAFSSLIFLKKLGGEIYELSLNRFSHDGNFLNLPEKVTLRFENSGNVHVVPRGVLLITDPFGREVLRSVINQGSVLILPESFRVLTERTMKTQEALYPGIYTIKFSYRYDGLSDPLAYETSFFYLGKLFFILLVSSGLVFIPFLVYRRYKKSKGRH